MASNTIPTPDLYAIKLKPGEGHTFMSYMPFVLSNAYCIAQLEERKAEHELLEQQKEYIKDLHKARVDKLKELEPDTIEADCEKLGVDITKEIPWTIHDRIELYTLHRTQAKLLDELRVWWNENYAYSQFLCTSRAYKPMDTSDTGVDTDS